MARGPKKSLYLEIGGNVTGLKAATVAGKTVLNEFGDVAINVLEEVEKEMAKIGSAGLPNLKSIENAYTASFKRIGDSARAVIDAPTPQAAVQIIDVNATRQAAESAASQAAALRLVAEAASRADLATGGTDKATRAYAASAATAAVNAETEAQALREQLAVLARVEGQLGINSGAMKRGTDLSGQARAGYQQLSYQLGDVATQFAAGTPISIIFGQQIGHVSQAVGLLTNKTTGFAGFLGGPWVVAAGAAAAILAPWVAKLLEGDDALGKETASLKENAEKAAIAERAKAVFSQTETGLIDDVRQLTDEIDKQNKALLTNAERLNIRSKNRIENLRFTRAEVTDELAAAQRDVGAAQISENAGAPGAVRAALVTVAEIEARLRNIDVAIAQAEAARLETQRDLAGDAAKRLTDPIANINRIYDGAHGLIELAKKQATAEEVVNGVLTRRLFLLEEARKADLKAERDRQSDARKKPDPNAASLTDFRSPVAGRTTGSFGEKRPGHVHSGIDYAVPVGTPVLAPATGKIAAAGERGNYGNVIEINFGGGTTGRFAHLSKFNVKPGEVVNAGDVIGYSGGAPGEPGAGRTTGPHLHYEIRRNGRAVDPRKGRFPTDDFKASDTTSADRKAEVEADRRVQNADAYASLLSQAQEQRARIERSRVVTISQAADLDVKAVGAQLADFDRAAQKGVELERWTQAEADAAVAVAASAAILEQQAIRDREKLALANQDFEIAQADLDDKVSLLKLQGDLATIGDDRRAIARQLLAIEQQQVTDALKNQIKNTSSPEDKAQLERRLAQVPKQYELKSERLERDNQDPLQAYGQRLIEETADLEESLKGVAARGFGAIEDASASATASAITNFLKLKGVAGDVIGGIIADLTRLAVKKAIIGVFGRGFFGLKDGGLADGYANGGLPGYAGGGVPFVDDGIIRGPGTGRSDNILALVGGRKPIMVSNGEGIVNERAVQRYWPLIDAMNKGSFPQFADGGLVAPTSFVPHLPSVSAAQAALQGGRIEMAPIRIVLGVTKGEAFAAEVLSVSGPATVQIIEQSMPAIANASAARTIDVLGRPGI